MAQLSRVTPALQQFGVAYAALFGSRVRGTATAESDYDFLVEFKKGKKYTLLDLAALKRSLEEVLDAPVDVVTTRSVHPYLKKQIHSNLEVIYDQRT